MTETRRMTAFPQLDEHDTPTAKLPNCPRCDDDELGVIHRDFMMCYACRWEIFRCKACGGTGIMEGNPTAPPDSILRCDVNCPEYIDP